MAKKKDDPLATKVLKVAGKGALALGKGALEVIIALAKPRVCLINGSHSAI